MGPRAAQTLIAEYYAADPNATPEQKAWAKERLEEASARWKKAEEEKLRRKQAEEDAHERHGWKWWWSRG